MSYSSLCLGCDKGFSHSSDDETLEERAYCDSCLKQLGMVPRGFAAAFDAQVEAMIEEYGEAI